MENRKSPSSEQTHVSSKSGLDRFLLAVHLGSLASSPGASIEPRRSHSPSALLAPWLHSLRGRLARATKPAILQHARRSCSSALLTASVLMSACSPPDAPDRGQTLTRLGPDSTVSEASLDSAWLQAALGAASWLESSAIETEHGVRFPRVPPQVSAGSGVSAESQDQPETSSDLYSGSSGVVVFLAELATATREPRWQHLLEAAADQLLVDVDIVETAGLYDGLSGVAATLLIAADAVDDSERSNRYQERVLTILAELAARFNERIDEPGWNDSTDIVSGTAGIGLFLLHAHVELQHDGALELARRAGDEVLTQASDEPAGLSWAMTPEFPRRMPNFSHGTAGVATYLARLGHLTGDAQYLDAGVAGARHLLSLAETEGDRCLIHHHTPGGESLYYMSWCHGPPGTARLFKTLGEATGNAEWSSWVERSANAILMSELPEVRSEGFWNNLGVCCGNGGVLDFLLSLYAERGEERYLERARRIARHTLEHATRNADGLSWTHAEHRTRPEEVEAQTGLMQGAAGIGLGFLRLAQVEDGGNRRYRLPDDPF